MFPEIDYKNDPNYQDVIQISYPNLFVKLFSGVKKTIYEYVKARLIFPLLYGALTKPYKPKSVSENLYLDNGYSKIIYENGAEEILKEIEKDLGIDVFTIDTEGDPRFKIRISKVKHSNLFSKIENVLDVSGAKNFARAQLGRRNLRLEEFYLFVQDTSTGWRDEISDLVSGKRTNTRYMHVDSTPPNAVAKFVIYLNDVTISNGAFQYVPKSHSIEKGFKAFVRRVIHHSRIQGMDATSRSYFAKLPECFQYKAEFGNDLDNEDWRHEAVTLSSKKGTVVMFDNSGIHRGGLIQKGRRVTIHGGFR